jgi:hypothetical protein
MLFAYRIADHAHFDLALEIADSERQKPWPSGIHPKPWIRSWISEQS